MRNRRTVQLFGLCLSIALCGAFCHGQEVRQTTENDTHSKSRVEAIDGYIERTRQQWQVPGLAVAIVKDGKVLLSKGYGVKEVGSESPVDENTLFAIASNTKAFTSAALAILVDSGKLTWDDPVDRYTPWFRLSDELATSDLRVRDLLCHRSGLGTFSGDLLWWGSNYSTHDVLQRTAKLRLAAPFRSKFGYSNLMFLLAGKVIESVSGQEYSSFIDQHILMPVGMNRTILSVRDLLEKGNFATPHKTYLDRSDPIAWMNWDNMVAGGGIISCSDDMAKWLIVQLNEGELAGKGEQERQLFSRKQSREMWEAQTPIPVSEAYSTRFPSTNFRAYGLGWSLADYLGRKTVGHGGGYDGMYSQVLMIPEEDLGIVVLTNSMTSVAQPITYHIIDTYLGAETRDWSTEELESFRKSRTEFEQRITKAIIPAIDPNDSSPIGKTPGHALDAYVGEYRCPMYGPASIVLEEGNLLLRLHPNAALVADLQHLHYDTFVVKWRKNFAWFDAGTANFISDSRGVVQRIELDIPNDDLFFDELKFRRVTNP